MGSSNMLTNDAIAPSSNIISYTASILSVMIVLFTYNYYKNQYTFFERRNLKGPTPYPLVGNLANILFGDRMKLEREWPKKYGGFYGVFFGLSPRFIVSDPELLQQVCIKDFAFMPNHSASKLHNDFQKNTIIFAQDETWKRLRSIQSPTFTSGKIKRMYKLLERCADDLVLNFSEQLNNGQEKVSKSTIDLKEIYSMYTMDAITTAAYAIKLDRKIKNSESSPRGSFVELAGKIFKFNLRRVLIGVIVPTGILKAIGFETSPTSNFSALHDKLRPILEQRRQSTRKTDDYLQILLDARLDDQIELDELDEKENHHAGLTHDSLKQVQAKMIDDVKMSQENGHSNGRVSNGATGKRNGLTDEEIISGAVFLLVVGLDTTATLLTNCTYTLAFHSEIQEKLYETLKAIAELDTESGEYSFNYDELTSCEYLDAVISESLRLLTPVLQVDRSVKEDYYVEKYGVQLKKGEILMLSYYSVMSNPEFWPEPLKFDPERFMGDNKKNIVPGSYCPFGLGPRHCLGMRFSLTEGKLALARVMMEFKFAPAPGTSFPPKFNMGLGIQSMKSPLVELSSR